MIKQFYGPKKRVKFDVQADWLPAKDRQFLIKQAAAPRQEPKPETIRKTSDKEGLDGARDRFL